LKREKKAEDGRKKERNRLKINGVEKSLLPHPMVIAEK